jgi:hypothetical protein
VDRDISIVGQERNAIGLSPRACSPVSEHNNTNLSATSTIPSKSVVPVLVVCGVSCLSAKVENRIPLISSRVYKGFQQQRQ